MKNKFLGRWANFSEEETKRIKKAYRILKKVSIETRHNNRDTQILQGIVKRLNFIVEQQYEEK
ncbi:MAG: hypothetical protein KAX28_11105 [Candidatus Marinimicrobia bacterium]|nr:hypothetical protein [Candidatus Neomarinimicrobiota bacterium]